MCAVSVCQSVCHAAQLGFTVRGSFGAASVKSLWPLVDWWHGAMVNRVGLINEVNKRRARLVLGWVTIFGR